MIEITTKVRDGGTLGLACTFKDTDDTEVTPTAVTWSLYDATGAIVNEREDVVLSVTSPATSGTIVLSGDDVLYADGRKRYLTLTYTYDSTTLGDAITDHEEIMFEVDNLVGV